MEIKVGLQPPVLQGPGATMAQAHAKVGHSTTRLGFSFWVCLATASLLLHATAFSVGSRRGVGRVQVPSISSTCYSAPVGSTFARSRGCLSRRSAAIGPVQCASSSLGSVTLGFSYSPRVGFNLTSHILQGANALEVFVTDLEASGIQRVFVVCGWNAARMDVLFWELEPRGFDFEVAQICEDATESKVRELADKIELFKPEMIISAGSGRVVEAVKAARALLSSKDADRQPRILEVGNAHLSISSSIPLAVIPILPCNGASTSGYSCLRSTSTNSLQLPKYVAHMSPAEVCVYDPVFTDRLPFDILHGCLFGTLGSFLEAFLANDNFMADLLASDGIHLLQPLLLRCEQNTLQKARSTTHWHPTQEPFPALSIHDDLHHPRSEYMRRFGHDLTHMEICLANRLGAQCAALRSGILAPGVVHVLSDVIVHNSPGQRCSYAEACAHVVPRLIRTLARRVAEAGKSQYADVNSRLATRKLEELVSLFAASIHSPSANHLDDPCAAAEQISHRLRSMAEQMGILSRGLAITSSQARMVLLSLRLGRGANSEKGVTSPHLCSLLTVDDVVEILSPDLEVIDRQREIGLDSDADQFFVLDSGTDTEEEANDEEAVNDSDEDTDGDFLNWMKNWKDEHAIHGTDEQDLLSGLGKI